MRKKGSWSNIKHGVWERSSTEESEDDHEGDPRKRKVDPRSPLQNKEDKDGDP